MLWLISIQPPNPRNGYVESAFEGRCYELGGVRILGNISYTVIDQDPAQPGWYVPPPPPPAPSPGSPRITTMAFRRRFTNVEWRDIEMAAAHNPADSLALRRAAASVRAFLTNHHCTAFVQLTRAHWRNDVISLEAAGTIGVGRATIILDTQPTDAERYEDPE
jgi:hypothetical protein